MGITITFADLTDAQKLQAADIIQKQAALNDLKAKIQTERAQAEIKWNDRTNTIEIELAKVEVALRAIRVAQVVA